MRSETPDEIVAILSDALTQALHMPETVEQILSVGATPWINTPDEQTAFGHEEVARWRSAVDEAGLTFD